MDANQWREECQFISEQVDAYQKDGTVSPLFKGQHDVLYTYLCMQQHTATREGFHDAAEYIKHCIDDLEASK